LTAERPSRKFRSGNKAGETAASFLREPLRGATRSAGDEAETGGSMSSDLAPCRLYLFRHGETEWSKSGQHTGSTDIPLTPDGEAKARALGPRLAGIAFARVFASPRLRARRTCELAGLGAGAEVDPELGEWDYGEYEGLRTVEIRAKRPGWEIFRDGCPGGESPGEIAARADRAIHRLRALSGNVALFSHGHFGRVLSVRWLGMAVGEARHFALAPATLSILGSDPAHDGVETMFCWNS
jgi:probable phosphoglycerate mutase